MSGFPFKISHQTKKEGNLNLTEKKKKTTNSHLPEMTQMTELSAKDIKATTVKKLPQ